jgi:hypothetical protein
MAYSQGGTILRSDLRGVVEEAMNTSETYIGLKALPALPVTAKAGQYPVVTKATGGLLKDNAKRRGPGANYSRTQRSWTNGNYTCIEYGSEAVVPVDTAADVSRFFDLEAAETRWKYREVQISHEIRTKNTLFAPATFNLTTSATAYTAALAATFDIGLDIDDAKAQILGRGESTEGLTAVMSLAVFNRIRSSTRLQNRLRGAGYSSDAFLNASPDAVAAALDIKEILIGRAAYDSAGEGSATISQIWSDTYIWLGQCVPAAGVEQYFSGGTGYSLFWQEDAAIIQTESYYENDIRSNIIRCRQHTAEKVINSNTAQLLVSQFS